MSSGKHAVEARRYLRSRHHGVLSTLSCRVPGYPFGSVAPFVLDQEARPVILISHLAEHTRNLEADRRASLLARGEREDVLAGARLTLVGDATPVDGDEYLRARYLRNQPKAHQLLSLGGFSFWRIEPVALRFVAGFGAVRWFSAGDFAAPASDLAAHESEILEQMNADHRDALRACCAQALGREVDDAVMQGVDCDGFDLDAGGERIRLDFRDTANDVAAVRRGVMEILRNLPG